MMHYDANYPDWVYPDVDNDEKEPSEDKKEKAENDIEEETTNDRP